MKPIVVLVWALACLASNAAPAAAKVYDPVPESIKTLAVAAYVTRYCPSLSVDRGVEREWLHQVGYAGDESTMSEHDIRAVAVLLDAYQRDSTMTCAAAYLGYGPMGSVVNRMVDRAFFLNGMIDLF